MIKKIMIILFLVITCSLIIINPDTNKNKSTISNIEQESNKEENNSDTFTDNDEIDQPEEESEDNTKVSGNKSVSTKKEDNNIKSTTSNSNTKTNTEIENENTNKVSENQNNNIATKSIWEELGMTEDEYYNKPMYDWEHIDFSVSTYGSESKTKEACLKYGDSYEPYLNGEESFNCSTVTSASGKYLGEMFYTEKLN